jgi:hypothetical protein
MGVASVRCVVQVLHSLWSCSLSLAGLEWLCSRAKRGWEGSVPYLEKMQRVSRKRSCCTISCCSGGCRGARAVKAARGDCCRRVLAGQLHWSAEVLRLPAGCLFSRAVCSKGGQLAGLFGGHHMPPCVPCGCCPAAVGQGCGCQAGGASVGRRGVW